MVIKICQINSLIRFRLVALQTEVGKIVRLFKKETIRSIR
jgi:hypothetical protein